MIDPDFDHEEQLRLEPELSEPADYPPRHEQTEDDLIQDE